MTTYLFDASSIINIVKNLREKSLDVLKNNYTIRLVYYEIGNAILKDVRIFKPYTLNEGLSVLNTIYNLLGYMRIIDITDYHDEILSVAEKLSITFYDASYLVSAFKKCLTFVTDDTKILNSVKANKNFLEKKFSACVNTIKSEDFTYKQKIE